MVKPKFKSNSKRLRSRSRSRSRKYGGAGSGTKPTVTKKMLTAMLNGKWLKPKKPKSSQKSKSSGSDWAAANARGMVVKGDGQ